MLLWQDRKTRAQKVRACDRLLLQFCAKCIFLS
jgi:hypothetical protein